MAAPTLAIRLVVVEVAVDRRHAASGPYTGAVLGVEVAALGSGGAPLPVSVYSTGPKLVSTFRLRRGKATIYARRGAKGADWMELPKSSEGVVRHPVEVESDGVTLRGWLFEPAPRSEQIPAVVMIHGFSATIDGMVADRYAAAFAETGVAALLVDTRGFGRSDGDPRRQINPWAEAQDYIACIDHLIRTNGIDTEAIAVWGDSLSGRVAAVVAAVDRRVAAVIVQCPAFGDELEPPDIDGSQFDTIRDILLDNTFGSYGSQVLGPMPVVSPDQLSTPSFLTPITAFHWFISYGARFDTGWQNQATMQEIDTPVTFSPQPCIPHIDVPFLLVVAEEDEMPMCDAAIARQVHASTSGPEEVFEIGGGHFGLVYHDSEYFTASVDAQRSFLTRHLLRA